MKNELDERLCAEFPLLYRDRQASMQETCMCWGFPGDGWFGIIYDLSSKLEPLIEAQAKHGGQARASQVKEKFGGLRFYMDYATKEMLDLCTETENLSYKTCETCGKPGKPGGGGWIKVLCDVCRQEY